MVALAKDGYSIDRNKCKEPHKMECECCSGKLTLAEAEAQQKQWLKEHGFYWHYIPTTEHTVPLANAHTHGLKESFDHPDLQITAPVGFQACAQVLHDVVGLIKEGACFKDGDTSDRVLQGMPVAFLEAVEGDRKVLRVILPDPRGNVTRDLIEAPWDDQFEDPVVKK